VEAIPLGGLGEFGMNMMVLRYEDQMIIIDSGLMFPDEELLGIDILVPDISFLIENASQIKALILTHGHEDHIGAIPFVLPALDFIPIFGTRFTLGLVAAKLSEHGLLEQSRLFTVKPRQVEEIGPFRIEFIHVTHSIVDAVMLAVTTPAGTILHTGDFKIDSSPIDGQVMDLPTIAQYGDKESWLSFLTARTLTDLDSLPRRRRSSNGWTRFSTMPSKGSSSLASHHPFTGFRSS